MSLKYLFCPACLSETRPPHPAFPNMNGLNYLAGLIDGEVAAEDSKAKLCERHRSLLQTLYECMGNGNDV